MITCHVCGDTYDSTYARQRPIYICTGDGCYTDGCGLPVCSQCDCVDWGSIPAAERPSHVTA